MQIDHHITSAVDRSVPRPVPGDRVETPTLESEVPEGPLRDLEIGPADEEVAVAVRPARAVVDPSSYGGALEQDARDAALS
jgi:hypothetical protein